MKSTILITARKQDPFPPFGLQTFFFEEIMVFANELGLQVYFADPLEQSYSTVLKGYEFVNNTWVDIEFQLPKFIYDRFSTPDEDLYQKAEQYRNFCLEQGCQFANPRPLVHLLRNKFAFHQFLEEKQLVDIPSMSSEALDKGIVNQWLDNFGGIYIKPCEASNGRGIVVLKKVNDQFIFFDEGGKEFSNSSDFFEKLKSYCRPNYIVQPEIKAFQQENCAFDLRCIVQNDGLGVNSITGLGIRVGNEESLVSNLKAGGFGLAYEEIETLLNVPIDKIALQQVIEKKCLIITEALQEEFGSICEIAFDILLNEKLEPVILEANANPGRWLFTKIADRYEVQNPILCKKYRQMRKTCVEWPVKYSYNMNK